MDTMGLLVFLSCIIGRASPAAADGPPPAELTQRIRRKSSSQLWQPSLVAISEDRAAVAAKAAKSTVLRRSSSARPEAADYGRRFDYSRSTTPAADLGRSQSLSGGSAGRVLPRGNSGRRGLGLHVIVPAFAPTGFIF